MISGLPLMNLKLLGKCSRKIVVKLIKQQSLDEFNFVCIGTDSCSVMVSELKGAVTEILKETVHAAQCPCLNNRLNNSLSKSNHVQCIRNLVVTIKSVVEFFVYVCKEKHCS